MEVKDFMSQCDPRLNARIMRAIENLVCRYRDSLGKGWRCCIEFQRKGEEKPYYLLDLISNKGGGDFAPIKMQTLKMFPLTSGTGVISLPVLTDALVCYEGIDEAFFTRLVSMHDIEELSKEDWGILAEVGVTHWYGGIRVPYDILVTEIGESESILSSDKPIQQIRTTKGEIRITFSGAKEWQDTFFCFSIFKQIQSILNELWDKDQIWYNLRKFKNDPCLSFWLTNLNIQEVSEDKTIRVW